MLAMHLLAFRTLAVVSLLLAILASPFAQDPAPDEGRMIAGRVTLRALDGSVAPLTNGELRLSLFAYSKDGYDQEQRLGHYDVPVVAGAFLFLAPGGVEEVRADWVYSRDVRILLSEADTTFDPRTEEARLQAVAIAPTIITAIDAGTEEPIVEPLQIAHLRPIALDRQRSHSMTIEAHRLGRLGISPYELWPASLSQREYRVGAQGYGWTRITIDPFGGEVQVPLQKAGHIEVSFSNRRRHAHARTLRLRRPGAEPFFEQPMRRPQFTDLAPGTWEITLEGLRVENPLVYARGQVEVRAGETAKLVLEHKELPQVNLVPVAGTILIPPAWDLPPTDLAFEQISGGGVTRTVRVPTGDLRAVEGRPGIVHFDAGELEPGVYRVGPAGGGLILFHEVPAFATGEVHLELPPPATVSLSFVDAETGTPAAPRNVVWSIKDPTLPHASYGKRSRAFSGPRPLPHVAPGRVEGRVPVTDLSFTTLGSVEHGGWSRNFDVPLEGLSHSVELERRTGLLVTCRVDGDPFPSIFPVQVRAIRAPAGGALHFTGHQDHGRGYEATVPGTYVIRVEPRLSISRRFDPADPPTELEELEPGNLLLPVPDREVVIEPGKLTYVEIDLPRATGFRLRLDRRPMTLRSLPTQALQVTATDSADDKVLEATVQEHVRTLLGPGTFLLTVAKIDGFAPIPPIEVVIPEGRVIDVPIVLVGE